MLDAVGHPLNQVLKVLLIPRANHIMDVVAQEGPVTLLRLDAKVAPQIEHVVRYLELAPRLEHETAAKILPPVLPCKPTLANLDTGDDQIGKHLVKLLDLHHTDFAA